MDFELPRIAPVKQSLRRFVNSELIRSSATRSRRGDQAYYREKLVAGAKALGIWMMEVPEEHGGPGCRCWRAPW